MGQRMLPDYAGGSIVNLMASLAQACGYSISGYPPTPLLASLGLANSNNIVLIVLDGMGDDYLQRHPRSFLARHLIGTLTSVFPSTTAAAITTFFTGVAPAQHGATGWHSYFSELDCVFTPLPGRRRDGLRLSSTLRKDIPARLFGADRLYGHLARKVQVLAPLEICDSAFNRYFCEGAEVFGYRSLVEFVAMLESLSGTHREPKFIYAYYPDHDLLCHQYGVESRVVAHHFDLLNRLFARFSSALHNTSVICTADHGMIDNPPGHVVDLAHMPEIANCLTQPLCGEPRAAYCYVKEEMIDRFAELATEQLGCCATCLPSSIVLDNGWYGVPPFSLRTRERIGDYVLLMEDDWTIKDWLPGEARYRQRAVHGGVSSEEMLVPLILLHT